MPCDRFNARLVRSHFLEERMIGLQIQHTRNFPIVRRFRSGVNDIVPDMLMNVIVMKICTGQYNIRIVVVHDDVWLLCGAIFRYYFHMRFMARTRAVICCIEIVYDYVSALCVSHIKIGVRIVIVNQNVLSIQVVFRIRECHVFAVGVVVVFWTVNVEIVVVRYIEIER